jgi:hypothetical protein
MHAQHKHHKQAAQEQPAVVIEQLFHCSRPPFTVFPQAAFHGWLKVR